MVAGSRPDGERVGRASKCRAEELCNTVHGVEMDEVRLHIGFVLALAGRSRRADFLTCFVLFVKDGSRADGEEVG